MLSFNELLAACRASCPSAVFCVEENGSVTYGEFVARVERIATAYGSSGIARGDRVALMLDHHLDHVAAFFALRWLGAIHVPTSIHLKTAGLALQLQDAAPHWVIAESCYFEELAPALEGIETLKQCYWRGPLPSSAPPDSDYEAFLQMHAEAPAVAPAATDVFEVAQISYTSGTTGAPKGALIPESFLMTGANQIAVLADIKADDVHLFWEPLYHLSGWLTVVMGLQRRIVLAHVERFSASRFWSQIRRFRVNKVHYMGSVIKILLAQQPRADDADNPVEIAWGGAAPPDAWREFETRFALRIREGYGSTEAGNLVLMNKDSPTGSMGRALPHEYDVFIAGPDGSRLAPGKTGEIVIAPRQQGFTMLGYFNRPADTAAVMREDGIHSGDLGYQDSEGNFYFAGRMKDALRRRGENVSAWEVERVVCQHPDVEDAAIIGVVSEMGEQDIKLFVTLAAGASPDVPGLLAWCKQKLAKYQVPRYIEVLTDFPRGPSQRVQKHLLSRSTTAVFDAERPT